MIFRYLICFLYSLFIWGSSNSQNQVLKSLQIGDKVPVSIWKLIPKKKETKLVILDFWNTYCGTCLEAFPKMQKLQKQFSERLQIVLINSKEDKSAIEKRLGTINNAIIKNGKEPIRIPSLAAISGDNIVSKYFFHTSLPHHVWINGSGIIKAITYGHNATPENVQAMLDGANINFIVKNDLFVNEVQTNGLFQTSSPLLPVIFYSAFMPYSEVGTSAHATIDTIKKTFRFSFYNASLLSYFRNAFRLKNVSERVLLELKNSEKYLQPTDDNLLDNWIRNNWFTYEIQGPLQDINNWQESMKIDVNRFFGSMFGIEGVMEKRKFMSLIIVKSKDGLLKSAGGERLYVSNQNLIKISNIPFEEVVNVLSQKFENMNLDRPFINETCFAGNVDMHLEGNLDDLENVNKQLKQYGLNIIEAEREVEVLVIRDKK